MTPLLRQMHLRAKTRRPDLVPILEGTIAFECTDIMDLVNPTVDALFKTTHYDIAREPLLNHGGLAVMPHEYVWLEWVGVHGRRIGVILCEEEYGISIGFVKDGVREAMSCVIDMLPNDECKIIAYRSDNNDSKEMAEWAGRFGYIALALLVIINAPYGIAEEVKPVHKGWAREAKAAGVTLKPTRRIYLDKTKAPPPEYASSCGEGSGRHHAFHFVRTHLRHFKDGSHTKVKAHWRGDPRLGIREMPEYKVRP